MKQIRNFGDERQTMFCAHCSRSTGSRDHVPSKVFLDKPYPTNLPVVPCCDSCNERFSLDEEYVACLIEWARIGSDSPGDVQREKIRRIFAKKPALVSRLAQARQHTASGSFFSVETERVRNVILKLARGHAGFELNEPRLDNPSVIGVFPMDFLASEIRKKFETPPEFSVFPEVGSRSMQRLMTEWSGSQWITVQPERYRYLACVNAGVLIRIVISEYLACECIWD